ncbi:monocarboxylate transporter 5 [Biomphalaria pfeifferi]|uniref:Monocarboxylate transporter 5 n=1 Tax=Biomphalaria pfeifferi TaxID=112525 RepID=A0AAD8BK10_BIOPF|nr:monocarboxylate transporter 5 [Biomphalaria pfeifferi]
MSSRKTTGQASIVEYMKVLRRVEIDHETSSDNDSEVEPDPDEIDNPVKLLSEILLDEAIKESNLVKEKKDVSIDDTGKNFHPVDKGYAWIVMIAAFGIQFLLIGYIRSLGVLFVELQSRYNSTSAEVYVIVAAMELTGSIASPMVLGFVLKRTSPRICCLLGSVFMVIGVAGNAWFSRLDLLCLTQGACFGISIGLLFGTPFVALTQYFDKRRALATSISSCGASLGGVVFPLLFRRLLDDYAFEGGVLLIAGVLLHAFIFSILLIPIENYKKRKSDFMDSLLQMDPIDQSVDDNLNNEDTVVQKIIAPETAITMHTNISPDNDSCALKDNNIQNSTNLSEEGHSISNTCSSCLHRNRLFRSVTFWILCGFYMSASIGLAVPQTFLPALAEEKGLTKDDGSFLVSLLNILDIPAHLIPGAIVNFRLLRPTRMCIVPMLVVGIMSNLTPFFVSYSSMLSMSIVYGLFMGTYFVMQPLIAIELLGAENFPRAMGIYYGITGLGPAISYPFCGTTGLEPAISYPFCGVLKDLSQSYTWTFHYLGTAAFMATALLVVGPMARKCDERRGIFLTKGNNKDIS